jgi:hypothetical protein
VLNYPVISERLTTGQPHSLQKGSTLNIDDHLKVLFKGDQRNTTPKETEAINRKGHNNK